MSRKLIKLERLNSVIWMVRQIWVSANTESEVTVKVMKYINIDNDDDRCAQCMS